MRAFPLRPDLQAAASSSYDADGFLLVGVDGDAATTNLPPAEALHPLGLCARPLDPGTDGSGHVDQGQACNVLRLVGDNTDDVVVLSDPRVTPKLLQLPKGGLVLYEPSDAADLARVVLNGDGSHGLVLHVAAGGPKILLEVAGGLSLTVDGAAVQVGGPGGFDIVIENGALATSFAALQAALAAKGITWTPPSGYTATKAKAT